MHKKDYIQSQLEEFGKVLSLILCHKKQQDWDKFEEEIQNASQKFTASDIDYFENLNENDFENEVLNHDALTQNQKKIVANLLFEKMSFYLVKNDADRYKLTKSKCLSLYEYLQKNFTQNEFDLDVHYKLDFLKRV